VALCVLRVDVGGDVFQNIGEQFLALFERLIGTTAAQRNLGQVGGLLDQADLFISRLVRLMMINGEGCLLYTSYRGAQDLA